MSKHPAINLPSGTEALLVQLTRPVRSANGQEFLGGMRAAFTPESARYLVEAGFATWLVASPASPVEVEPAPAVLSEAPQVAPATRAPVSMGEGADGPTISEAPHTLLPSRRRRG